MDIVTLKNLLDLQDNHEGHRNGPPRHIVMPSTQLRYILLHILAPYHTHTHTQTTKVSRIRTGWDTNILNYTRTSQNARCHPCDIGQKQINIQLL